MKPSNVEEGNEASTYPCASSTPTCSLGRVLKTMYFHVEASYQCPSQKCLKDI